MYHDRNIKHSKRGSIKKQCSWQENKSVAVDLTVWASVRYKRYIFEMAKTHLIKKTTTFFFIVTQGSVGGKKQLKTFKLHLWFSKVNLNGQSLSPTDQDQPAKNNIRKNKKKGVVFFQSMLHLQGFLIKPQSHLRWVHDGALCHAVNPEGGSLFFFDSRTMHLPAIMTTLTNFTYLRGELLLCLRGEKYKKGVLGSFIDTFFQSCNVDHYYHFTKMKLEIGLLLLNY